MIIHALANNDVEHQSHLKAFFFLLVIVCFYVKNKNPLGSQETATCT